MLMRTNPTRSTLDDESPLTREHSGRAHNLGGTVDLRGTWLVLRWHARLVASVTLAAVIATAALVTLIPAKYKATTVLLIDPRQPRVTNSEAVISGIGSDAAAVESQVELIESSALAQKVIARFNLANDPDFNSSSLLDRVAEGVMLLIGREPAAASGTEMNRLVYRFQGGLSVRRRGLTYVLEVSYSSKDAQKAARLSNGVAEAYLEDQRAAKSDITARASGWLGDRIEELRDRVRKAEQAVADYKSANSSVDVTQGNKLISRQIEDLTQQLTLARSRTAETRAKLAQVEAAQRSGGGVAPSEALQSPVITSLRNQYAEASRIASEYGQLYGDRHPAMTGIRAQVATLRRQIDEEIVRIAAGVRNDYEVARGREATLDKELARLKNESLELNRTDVKLRELEREAQATRALFEQYLSRAKETNEQQSLQIAEGRIVSPALVPVRPDRPSLPILVAAGGIGGFILALGLVMILEQARRNFRTGTDVEQVLGLPALGSLPRFSGSSLLRGAGRALRQSVFGASATDGAREALDNPASPYSGTLRAVRTRLQRTRPHPGTEILAVISALPGEGKSTFACNLALASSAAGARTLLIDGDIFTRSASAAFGLRGPGLIEVSQGAPFRSAVTVDKSGLHVLGAGSPAREADTRMVDENRLEAFLGACRDSYDLIVIDTPAILPMAGTMPFIDAADRAVMVVEWEATERDAAGEAVAILGPQARKIAGVVLNKVAPKWHRLFDSGRYLDYRRYAYAQTR